MTFAQVVETSVTNKSFFIFRTTTWFRITRTITFYELTKILQIISNLFFFFLYAFPHGSLSNIMCGFSLQISFYNLGAHNACRYFKTECKSYEKCEPRRLSGRIWPGVYRCACSKKGWHVVRGRGCMGMFLKYLHSVLSHKQFTLISVKVKWLIRMEVNSFPLVSIEWNFLVEKKEKERIQFSLKKKHYLKASLDNLILRFCGFQIIYTTFFFL